MYGNSVPKVKALAEKLRCQAYHHHAVGKASLLAEFIAGKQRVIIATSALGIGVDVPDIQCIIHIDWPFSVLDYAQESGRARRDREWSEAIIIVQDGEQRAGENKQGEVEQQLVGEYIEGRDKAATYRRVVLDRYLDRREAERAQCEEREERCNIYIRADREEREDKKGENDSSNEEEAEIVEAEAEAEAVEAETVEREQEEARQAFD